VKACALFGITDVRVLPFPHHYLRPSRELDQAIADIILELRPHLLLTHATYASTIKGHSDTRPSDHLTTGLAADLRQWLSGKLEAVRQDCGASGEPMPARLDF
jgi:LmbE family N-acetylglucosaminyl deacetylase